MSRTLFHLAAFATTVFIITILAMVAMLMGDPVAPANLWFNEHGSTVLIVEVSAIVLLGLAAMTADRRETLRAQQSTELADTSPADERD